MDRSDSLKKDIVFMKENSFVYNNNEYVFDEILEKHMLFKKLEVIILEEMLYIKNIPVKFHFVNLEKYILDKIRYIFPQNGEILYDYERDNNKNLIYIYSVKGKDKVEKLSHESTFLEVIPIQFIMRKILNKILRNKNESFMALMQFDNNYYFIKCRSGVFVDNYVSENIMKIYDYFNEKNLEGKIIVDKVCSYDEYCLSKLEIIKMDIVGLIYENL